MAHTQRNRETLTNFKRSTSRFLERLEQTGQPVLLTIHGKVKLIVQDADSYQELLEWVDRLETIEGVNKGLAQKKAGMGTPSDEIFSAIRKSRHRQKKVAGSRV